MDTLTALESLRDELSIKTVKLENVSPDVRKLGKAIVESLDKVIAEAKAGE